MCPSWPKGVVSLLDGAKSVFCNRFCTASLLSQHGLALRLQDAELYEPYETDVLLNGLTSCWKEQDDGEDNSIGAATANEQ